MYQLLQLSRCNRKNCLNLFYVCDFWKSEDFQFTFHILCIGSDKIGHDFRNFYKLFFWGVKRHKKDVRISPDTVVTVPTSCPLGTRLVHLINIADSFQRFRYCDMLPPLKSQILKWGLLAQWLYWAKYLQAILACPAIFLPGHGHIYYLLSCPDTDSLCCQHPSYLFTDIDRCISISVHLISARTAVNSFG